MKQFIHKVAGCAACPFMTSAYSGGWFCKKLFDEPRSADSETNIIPENAIIPQDYIPGLKEEVTFILPNCPLPDSIENVPVEKDCVTISELQEIATRHGYTHIVMLSLKPGNFQFVATFGETIEQSDQAAQMGNRLKDLLGWPERLHATPSRVQELVDKIKKYESILKTHDLEREAGIQ
jgi:hypothetical protein